MTRIVRFHRIGGPEVLQIDTVDVPAPGLDDIQLRVKAIGLNRAEVMFRSGEYTFMPRCPASLGYEASGIVAVVGRNVMAFGEGDAVSVVPAFSFADYGMYGEVVNVPARAAVKHPQMPVVRGGGRDADDVRHGLRRADRTRPARAR